MFFSHRLTFTVYRSFRAASSERCHHISVSLYPLDVASHPNIHGLWRMNPGVWCTPVIVDRLWQEFSPDLGHLFRVGSERLSSVCSIVPSRGASAHLTISCVRFQKVRLVSSRSQVQSNKNGDVSFVLCLLVVSKIMFVIVIITCS